MRSLQLALTLVALSVAVAAQQPAQIPAKAAKPAPAPVSSPDPQKLHESAMKFMEVSEARQRLSQSLDKLLEDGRQAMMQKNPGLDPQFGEEWLKRMHRNVNLDDFVSATARVYERYFTAEELNELTRGQLAFKMSQVYSLSPKLADKMKSSSSLIQRDINTETSVLGGRLGAEVGKGIEKEHPEWIKPAPSPAPAHLAQK